MLLSSDRFTFDTVSWESLIDEVARERLGESALDIMLDSEHDAIVRLITEANPYHDERGRFASKTAHAAGLARLDDKTLAAQAADKLADPEQGGFTMNLSGSTPDDGIMVSFPKGDGHSRVLDPSASPEATRAAVRDWVRENRDFIAASPDRYAGGWLDTSTGKVYLDVSQRFEPSAKAAAIAAGKERNQIAIFDLGSFEEIPTGGTGE